MGIVKTTRVEQSRIYKLNGRTREEIIAEHLDPMTQAVYPFGGPKSFMSDFKPDKVQIIRVLEQGEEAIRQANKHLGLGMDEWDIRYYTQLFIKLGRNPTDVELFQIGNANSEHCRHWFFKGKLVIDGVEMTDCLLDVIRAPLGALKSDDVSILSFNDNVGALRGHDVSVLVPINPDRASHFKFVSRMIHLTITAESHNHPTLISPYAGAATGYGGQKRDTDAGGEGSLPGMGFAGYCTGNLKMPGYEIAGEVLGGEISDRYASPLRILIEGSNGLSDYANQFGEPLGGGFVRSFDQNVSGERRAFIKPVLYSGGVGHIDGAHIKKQTPKKGMLIVAIGGPAYAIGVGGGAASSMMQGQNSSTLDFNSVQRGDGEMGHKTGLVIRACVEMGDKNPIESIHDQGAGGPSNVLTELMERSGGTVNIREIVLGDKTMSVLAIWSAEYQERYGLLIKPGKIKLLQRICKREKVNCEVLGKITGDGHVTVKDPFNGATPVHLNLEDILGSLPQKTFVSNHLPRKFDSPKLPASLTFEQALEMVLQQLSVGSKGYLAHKVDRSVTGKVAQQPCCGPSQVTIADVAVLADGYLGLTGAASAIGEQPIKMLINPAAGARMAISEMITNLMSAGGIEIKNTRCRANWMWPAKMPGEGALMYDAAVAVRDAMIKFWMAFNGGKDSLSMVATVGDKSVKAPGQLIIFGCAAMPDITKIMTPDIKVPGQSCLGLIDLGLGKNRLGGSALLQALNQVGDESPDCDPELLKVAWEAIQLLHANGIILSLHDRSDGGLAATVAEMCLGGNCGAVMDKNLDLSAWFAEEAGLVIEYLPRHEDVIRMALKDFGALDLKRIGKTERGYYPHVPHVFGIDIRTIRQWYEATSYHIEKLQTENGVADEELASYGALHRPPYDYNFSPAIITKGNKPKIAILREEGTNGDREMAAAFSIAGLNPMDVHMSDLLSGEINLDLFQGLIAPGGFSFMDVFGSAKGWAGVIKFNPVLKEMFDRFYNRPNTFSLGVCNGCQLFEKLGWIPLKDLPKRSQPKLVKNLSGRFESRWSWVRIKKSPAILFEGMEGSTLGVHVAHGEGRFVFPDKKILELIKEKNLAPLVYVDSQNEATESYPFNPNGSELGIAALCSPDGRHLAMMPHPERAFLPWQWHHWPREWSGIKESPWKRLFQNARNWCLENR